MTLEEETIKKVRWGSEDLKGQGELLQKVVEEAVRKVLAGAPFSPPSGTFPFPKEKARTSSAGSEIQVEAIFPSDPQQKGILKKELSALTASIQGKIGKGKKKVLLFTSPGEGPALGPVSAWVAATWAFVSSGTVLLMDGNLGNPSLHQWFGVDAAPGLSGILNGRNRREEAWRRSDRMNFFLLPGGEPVPDPSWWSGWEGWPDLLSLLKTDFDVLFIEAPPLFQGPETDWMLPWVDASILILKAGQTSLETARKAVQRLEGFGGFLGVIWLR